jgi:TfoX/Sxy family transcriptional regulator of competence genes
VPWRKSDPELSALFGRAVPADPRIDKRKMFGCPAALVDGKLFGCVHQDSFVLKFGEADRAILRDDFDAHGYEFMAGRGIRDFVAMPDEILGDMAALGDWIGRSIAHVAAKKAAVKKPAKKSTPKTPAAASRKKKTPAGPSARRS